MTITVDVLDRFQENKVFQTAQTLNYILRSNTEWKKRAYFSWEEIDSVRNIYLANNSANDESKKTYENCKIKLEKLYDFIAHIAIKMFLVWEGRKINKILS